MSTFGERLKEERNKKGLSQAAFGEAMGVGKHSQINYESDKRRPDADYLLAAAEQGVDIGYLLRGEADAAKSEDKLIDAELMDHIIERLEAMAKELNKQWPAYKLMRTAVQVYNFVQEGDDVDTDEKMDRVLRLVVDR